MDSLYNQEEIQSQSHDQQFNGLDQAQNVNQEQKIELYKKYLYFNRFHNLRTTRFSYQSLIDPAMIIMLNYFFDKEIKNEKFHNIDLELSLEQMAFEFDDFKIKHL